MAVPPASIDRFDFDALHRAVSDVRSKRLFFIGGAPKSGTTWLQLLLNAHPEISCGGEGHFPNRLLPALAKALKGYNATIDLKNRTIFEQLDGQPLFTNRHALYLMAAATSLMLRRPEKAVTAPVVGDKTPDNVRYFPLLSGLFPRAKFIHIVRDARDCTVSAWFHNLRLNPAQVAKRYPSFEAFSDHFARVWVTNVKAGAEFAARHPERCLTIRYEDLCGDPSLVLDRVCGFLHVPRDATIIQACCAATDFARLSGGRSRGDEDRGSFFRRGVAGDWRGHFDATAERAFRAKVEPWMSKFRYAMESEQAA
jgi:hypothetical protein